MSAEKTVSMSFRVTPQFRELLERAAIDEQRSRTNLLEKLLFDHCRLVGLIPSLVTPQNPKKRGLR